MPDLATQGQLSRAKNWIQGISITEISSFLTFLSFIDWKSKLDDIQTEDTPSSTTTSHNWREIFDYDELIETNKDSSLWNEIHRPWWSPPPQTDKQGPSE